MMFRMMFQIRAIFRENGALNNQFCSFVIMEHEAQSRPIAAAESWVGTRQSAKIDHPTAMNGGNAKQ